MIGKDRAIRKYHRKLPKELSKRYGGNGPYTEAQVSKTIDDLGLSKRLMQYALLMYCQPSVIASQGIDDETASSMLEEIEIASQGGNIVSAPIDTLFGGADSGDFGGGGGFGDGGGGSDG